jgi:outer membrane protein assembly factor BamB
VRFIGLLCLTLLSRVAVGADWPQWGGRDCRNLVSQETGLPDSFGPGKKKSGGGGIDLETTRNVKWIARLGSAAYGNPTVAGGKVFVGTDNLTLTTDPRFKYSRGGLVKCLDEATGKLLWQLVIPERTEMPKAMHFGHQHLGVCSSSTVEDGKLYLGTKRHFFILAAGKELAVLDKIRLGSPAYSTTIAANGVLYVASQQYLWAVEQRPLRDQAGIR